MTTDRFWQTPHGYLASVLATLVLFTAVGAWGVYRYEDQQVQNKIALEQSKLSAIYALSRLNAGRAFSGFERLRL